MLVPITETLLRHKGKLAFVLPRWNGKIYASVRRAFDYLFGTKERRLSWRSCLYKKITQNMRNAIALSLYEARGKYHYRILGD